MSDSCCVPEGHQWHQQRWKVQGGLNGENPYGRTPVKQRRRPPAVVQHFAPPPLCDAKPNGTLWVWTKAWKTTELSVTESDSNNSKTIIWLNRYMVLKIVIQLCKQSIFFFSSWTYSKLPILFIFKTTATSIEKSLLLYSGHPYLSHL